MALFLDEWCCFLGVIPANAGIHLVPGRVIAGKPAACIFTSAERGTLYVGVTGSLKHRIWERREGLVEGFTKKLGVRQVVWFELLADFPTAIARETQIRKWNRAWKIESIEKANPEWRDLWRDLID